MIIRVLMENTAQSSDLTAEHGLSLYIETTHHKILFDAGQSTAFANNAEKMGVDLSKVDLCILSHGHYDHSGGLARFLELNDHAPVYVHERAFEAHHNASGKYIGVDQTLANSDRIVYTGDHLIIDDELSLCTCNDQIDGIPASARGMTVCTEGVHVQDDFLHEQYLTIQENGRRVVISGCSHKGILNIVRWLEPDALVGGFHFMKLDADGKDAALLESAAAELLSHPCTYYTGHCTGDAAFSLLKTRMVDRLHAIPCGNTITL